VGGCASCEKSKAATDTGAIKAADEAEKHDPSKPVDKTPVPGVDVSKLKDEDQTLFFRLVDSFSSPCGKAHSLRTSVVEDKTCKRAVWAAKYLAAMCSDEIGEDDIKKLWDAHYKDPHENHTFKLDDQPHAGSVDAPIKVVEFFDYGCPACQAFKPVMDQVIDENSATTVVYYKFFPLTDKHPDSLSAAQAAWAAYQQGKFKEFHDALFERQEDHARDGVMKIAQDLGLDMKKFETDYDAAESRIRADMAEGDSNSVDGTPTIFLDGVQYQGPAHPRYFKYWIDEDLAVNR